MAIPSRFCFILIIGRSPRPVKGAKRPARPKARLGVCLCFSIAQKVMFLFLENLMKMSSEMVVITVSTQDMAAATP